MAEHRCPICGHAAEPDRAKNPSAPFCTPRCKTIDLGRWLGEGYRIPVDDESGGGTEDPAARGDGKVPPKREG